MRGKALIPVALLVFSLAPQVPATGECSSTIPANDCFASAMDYFGKPLTLSNVGATLETGEPAPCGNAAKTVWFRLQPQSTGTLRAHAEAGHYATLAVYTGASMADLTLLGCAESWFDEEQYSPTVYFDCQPGTTYWVQVGGVSGQAGSFELRSYRETFWDPPTCAFAPTLPTEPRLYAPAGGNGRITVSWVEPWWDGGELASISHYRVHRSPAGCAGPWILLGQPSSRSWSDTGLPPGATYCYKVTAVNSVGEGPSEAPRSATTWPLPRPPVSLAASPSGDGGIALAWPASPDAGGPAPFLGYRVRRADTPSGPFEDIGSTTASVRAFTDTGLGRGTTKSYEIAALSEVGVSAPGPVATATTYRVPGTPHHVAVRHIVGPLPLAFEVTWQRPLDPEAVTRYDVYRASSPTAEGQFIGDTTQLRFVDSGRSPFVDYHYYVRAWNPAGDGLPSSRACIAYPLESSLGAC